MFLIVAAVAGIVLLVALWAIGDVEFSTKTTFTLLYAASWGLLLINGWLAVVALTILDALMWLVTFGSGKR